MNTHPDLHDPSALLIRGGRLVDPASDTDGLYDILLRDGRIAEILPGGSGDAAGAVPAGAGADAAAPAAPAAPGSSCPVLDASGLVVAPGLIDTHSHFRDPGFTYKEDLLTGAAAAAKGGYTSIILMANTKPVVDNVEVLTDILRRGSEAPVHLYSCSNVTVGMQGCSLAELDALADAGAAGFTDDGLPIQDGELLRRALRIARRRDLPVSLHEEDKSMITENGINAGGHAARVLGLTGAPREAEISMIRRDVQIAVEEQAPLCIQHISTAEGVQLIREARKQNPRIHAEATPHHFSLTEEAVLTRGTLAKVNPPLRLESDRRAIIEGLADGTLDLIATDHAPHAAYEKEKPFVQAPSGMIGLETALPLAIEHLVRAGYLSLSQMLACLTVHPADFYHLPAGRVAPGAPADLVLFDPDEAFTVPDHFASKSSNSPFIGMRLHGVVKYTIAGGRIVYSFSEKEDPKK